MSDNFRRSGLPGGTGNLGFFTQLPPGRTRAGGSTGKTGRVVIRTNAQRARDAVAEFRARVPASIFQTAEEKRSRIEARLRAETEAEYVRSATQRFSRGLRATINKSQSGDKAEAIIRVTSINYREARFLTNIGGRGYFKFGYPVEPYTIFAKGAEGITEQVRAGGRREDIFSRTNARLAGRFGAGRLKVPKPGTFFEAFRRPGRGGGESRGLRGMPDDLTLENFESNSGFFYPLWVHHPGFRRDVVSDVARDEGAKFIVDNIDKIQEGLSKLGGDPLFAVSDEIPITSTKVRLRTRREGVGGVDEFGFQRLVGLLDEE